MAAVLSVPDLVLSDVGSYEEQVGPVFLFSLDTNTGLLYVIAPLLILNHYIVVLYIYLIKMT